MKTFCAVLFLIFTSGVFCQNIDLFPLSTTNLVVNYNYYSLSFSQKDRQAEWVAYHLNAKMPVKNTERNSSFTVDKNLQNYSATNNDYKGSGYDKGHLCPAADMSFSETAMKECFYLSNISPQLPGFNRGIWKSLEELVRDWVVKEKDLFVVCGPVLTNISKTIGNNKVSVPGNFYKIIFGHDVKGYKMIAFLFPNLKADKSLESFIVSVDSIEKITGIDFFPALPDSIENLLECNLVMKNWDFSQLQNGNIYQRFGDIHNDHACNTYCQKNSSLITNAHIINRNFFLRVKTIFK